MKTIKSVLPKAGMIFLIFTLLCGVIYTGVVTGIAQLIFPDNANGRIDEHSINTEFGGDFSESGWDDPTSQSN